MKLHLWLAALAAALFSVESWILGPLSWIYGYGSGLETIPVYLALAFDHRNFSLWAPFVGGGVDRLAFWGNADPVSVEMLFFGLLPTWLANGLHRYLQYFVAIFFMARVCEEQLSLDARWSGFGGLLHASFGYFTVGNMFTIPGVPFLVWLLDRVVDPRRGIIMAVLAGIGVSTLTTFTFGVPYLLVFSAGWLLLVRRVVSAHASRQFLLFWIALGLAESPQLMAVITNVASSHRAGWPLAPIGLSIDGLFYRQLLFDMFAQDRWLAAITLNLPGLAFLLGLPLALVARRYRADLRQASDAFLSTFALYALLSQKWMWLSLQQGVSHVFPPVAGLHMGRFWETPATFLIAAGLALMSYIGWQLVLVTPLARRCAIVVAAAFIGFMLLWPKVHLLYPLGIDDWGEKNYQVAVLDEIRQREREPFRVASVLPLQPAYAYAQGLETADGWANLIPGVYRDLWLRVLAPLLEKLPRVKNIFDPAGDRPQDNYIFLGADLILPEIGALPGEDPFLAVKQGFDLKSRFNLDLLRLLNVKYLLSEYPLNAHAIRLVHAPDRWPRWPQSRSHATGLVHWRRPQDDEKGRLRRWLQPFVDLGPALERKRAGKDLFVYEVLDTMPRFRFVERAVVRPDGRAVLDLLSSFDARAHASTVVLEAKDAAALQRDRFEPGEARLVRYAPDEIELAVTARDGFLVIANTWNPYWRAEVDGRPRDLLRVNHAQFGLAIARTDRNVRLFYSPPYSPRAVLSRLSTWLERA